MSGVLFFKKRGIRNTATPSALMLCPAAAAASKYAAMEVSNKKRGGGIPSWMFPNTKKSISLSKTKRKVA